MSFKTKFSPSFKDEKNDAEDLKKIPKESTKDALIDTSSDSKFKPSDNDKNTQKVDKNDESKFDRIDWSKPHRDEQPPNKFDTIDWSKKPFQTRERDKFDTINWKEPHGVITDHKKEATEDTLNMKLTSPTEDRINAKVTNDERREPKTEEQMVTLYRQKGGKPYFHGEPTKGFKEFKKQFRHIDAFTHFKQAEHNPDQLPLDSLQKKVSYEENYRKVSQLSPKFLEYKKYATKEQLPNVYPNRAGRITNKFIDWIKENEPNPDKTKEYLDQIKYINQYKNIQDIVKDKIENSNISIKAISRALKLSGLNMSPQSIKKTALREIYNGNQAEMKKRFPSGVGGFLQENYNLEKDKISTHNIEKIREKFIKYHNYAIENKLKTPYANRGAKITSNFINWISKNESNLNKRNEIIHAAKQITQNGEIPQLVIKKTISSNLSMHQISAEIKKKGIYLSEHAISKYTQDHIFKNKIEKIYRFPSPEEVLSDDLKKKIREEVNKDNPLPQRWISEKLGVSRGPIERIAKLENTTEEYERKWPARERVPEKIHNLVINDIVNTNLNQAHIADKYNISPNTVKRFAQDEVYKDDYKSYKERFQHDENFYPGILTHRCILNELTDYFSKNYKEKFYAEPRIYRSSYKGCDGLILNDQNFLQNRLKNPFNTFDLCNTIHGIPAKSLTNQFDHIKAIQIDLTNNISDRNVLNKIEKYQLPNVMLYIVGTRWYYKDPVKPLPVNDEILYPKNIKVISYKLFSELIGIGGKSKENYNEIINLNFNSDIEALEKICNSNTTSWNNKDDIRSDLKQKNLIKRRINEFFKIPSNSKK